MPEIHFQIEWPDGQRQTCYSPSLVIQDYFSPGEVYELDDFVGRSRLALSIASDRVKAKYGFPCARALQQLQDLEAMATQYQQYLAPKVVFVNYSQDANT